MKIILYTTHCPMCNILENLLDKKGLSYEKVEDINVMIEKGFKAAPILEVDNNIYTFPQAKLWIGEQQ